MMSEVIHRTCSGNDVGSNFVPELLSEHQQSGPWYQNREYLDESIAHIMFVKMMITNVCMLGTWT
jgi:hypothetical protein